MKNLLLFAILFLAAFQTVAQNNDTMVLVTNCLVKVQGENEQDSKSLWTIKHTSNDIEFISKENKPSVKYQLKDTVEIAPNMTGNVYVRNTDVKGIRMNLQYNIIGKLDMVAIENTEGIYWFYLHSTKKEYN